MSSFAVSARTCLTSLILVVATIAAAQDWTSQGSITSRQYQNQIREGNQIVATEFFTLEYSVDTWIEDTGQKQGPHMVCDNKCNGLVHDDHSKCNYSCDARCTETHRATVRGEYRPDRAAMNQATRDANALALQGGGTHSPSDWSHRVSSALAEFRREARKSKTFTLAHAGPCSGIDEQVGTKTFSFHVRGTMKKTGYRMSRGVRTPINETVGTHEKVVATADIVQDEPLSKTEWTKCRCKGKKEPVDLNEVMKVINTWMAGAVDEFSSQIALGVAASSQGIVMKNKAGEYVDPGESKVTVKPADMNRCSVEIENGTGQDVEVTIPVGTTFVCSDSGTQSMSSSVVATGMLYAGETKTIFVSLAPQQRQTTVDFPFRWFCTQMSKKAPTASSKFTMKAQQDDVLTAFGALTNGSRIRGPHDQARVWIYTDKATFDEINDRLFPGVTEGRYMSLLWEVATIGGVDVTAKEYLPCLEPRLLVGLPTDDRAGAWLVSMLAETKAKDLVKFVNSSAPKIASLAESDKDYGPGFVATVATALLSEDSEEVRMAGIKLVSAVPSSARSAFAEKGGLVALSNCFALGKTAEATEALDALLAYSLDQAGQIVGAEWEQLPTESLKAKARKFLGIAE